MVPLDRLSDAVAWYRHPVEIADELWVDVPTLEARVWGLGPRWGDALPEEVAPADVQAWVAGMTVAAKRRLDPKARAVLVERPASHTIRSKAAQALGGALRIAQEAGRWRHWPLTV